MKFRNYLILIILLLVSCQHIETGNSLNKKTIAKLKSMGLLEDGEKVIKFYSNYKKNKAGNFFTDKRIAHYWIDDHDSAKTDISYAYYPDVAAIDSVFNVRGFDIPYMVVTKTDGSSFKVYIEGTAKEEQAFFEEAVATWKKYGGGK